MTQGGRPAVARYLRGRIVAFMNNAPLLRKVFWLLRRFRPVLVAGGTVVVSRHAELCEVLGRDDEFTVPEGSRISLERLSGPFVLRMNQSPEYQRERGSLDRAVQPGDLDRIRASTRQFAVEVVEAARGAGRLDVVHDLAGPATAQLAATYFGVPGPDQRTLLRWMATMFRQAFLNVGGDAEVKAAGERSAEEFRLYADELVAGRISDLAGGGDPPDNLLTRLVRARAGPGPSLDDEGVRRNLIGLVVAGMEQIRAVSHIVDELLRRPEALSGGCRAAAADDLEAVAAHAFEALRFHPTNPVLPRQADQATTLTSGGGEARSVPGGSDVLVGVLSAMFDPAVFDDPGAFRTDRPASAYLHFGHGLHECFAKHINQVLIPEVVAALLRLPGLGRAPGPAGKLSYDGPFPRRLLVEFDRPA